MAAVNNKFWGRVTWLPTSQSESLAVHVKTVFDVKGDHVPLNITSEPRQKWTFKVQYFFMKIHASAWQCIKSHFWTKKKVNFQSSIFLHENSCKCMQHGTGELAQTLVLKMRSQVSREKRVLPRWPICRSRFVDFGGHFVFS